jgi:membrane protein YqaA with SNARE-associated domain
MFLRSFRPSLPTFFQAAQQSIPAIGKKAHLLRWLMSFGALGVFLVAIIDSSMIPMPIPGSTDLLLLLLASQRGASPLSVVWLAAYALVGSLIGGYSANCAGA